MLVNLSSAGGSGNKGQSFIICLLVVLLLIWAFSCTPKATPAKGYAQAYNDSFALYAFPLKRNTSTVYFYPIWHTPPPQWLVRKDRDTLIVIIESGKPPVYKRFSDL